MKTLLTPTPLILIEVGEDWDNIRLEKYYHHMVLKFSTPKGGYYMPSLYHKLDVIGGFIVNGISDIEIQKPSEGKLKTYYSEEEIKDLLTSHSLSLDKKYLIIKPKN